MQYGHSKADEFWNSLKDKYTIQASIGISGKHYNKYGTNFGVSLTVIDKVANLNNEVPKFAGHYDDIKEALNAIEQFPKRVKYTNSESYSGGDGLFTPHNEQLDRRPRFASKLGDETKPTSNDRNSPKGKQESSQISIFEGSPLDKKLSKKTGSSSRNNDELHSPNLSIEYTDLLYPLLNEPVAKLKEIGGFVEYAPSWIENTSKHPGSIVETKSMNGVKPPAPAYIPKLPTNILDNISSLQLESVIYAGQRHNVFLPTGKRAGYFIGDGTGLGKGRTIASIICDNFNHD